ncbi:hypothetical protein EDD16DRAFT_1709487 [Pisolithus croceorrhizus]|nr:hypothetical protein EDD16DRAFT_1709487 [Pisolithus croceorrhizus]KAI6134362.1 hypothetical protein EV401DRAFT_2064104 [Pisolithus croceorrhizus]KAI6146507.1 hypothetical protein EDD17DRAFT_1901413 [Pisolithus thermaeus]
MSSVTDSEATINAFVTTIRPDFGSIIANAAFSACLFTLFVLLLALSTKESRRRVVFRLNVLAICIALTTSILGGLIDGKAIVDPFNLPSTDVFIAASAFVYFPPLLYDSILLTRLLALYPPSSTPPVTLLKIFAFPFCIKCARLAVITLIICDFVRTITTTTTEILVQEAATVWFRNPNMIAEWTMQIVDNMYSVSLFLHNLHVRVRPLKSERGIPNRIRQIFYISVANFVLPLVFNITLLVFVVIDPSTNPVGVLILTNNYVTVMGVMCATVWFSRPGWTQTRKEPSSEEMLRREPNFPRAPIGSGMGWGEVVVIGPGTFTVDSTSVDNEASTDSKQLTAAMTEDRHSIV